MKKPLKVPEYFKDLPDDANLNSRDVAEIFGFKLIKSVTQAYVDGRIPHPDKIMKCGSEYRAYERVEGHGHVRLFWKVKTIREWIESHQ